MTSKNPSKTLIKYKFTPKEKERGEITRAESGTIYYLIEGRNAWHSTWVQTYGKNCMHTDLKTAKKFAEKNRINGSVFTIQELPCLVLRTSLKTVVITEINNNKILENHILMLEKENIAKKDLHSLQKRCSDVSEMVKSFFPESFFWRRKVRKDNSIMVLEHQNSDIKIHKEKHGHSALSSVSHGGDFPLNWVSSSVRTIKTPPSNISKNINALISSHEIINYEKTLLIKKK